MPLAEQKVAAETHSAVLFVGLMGIFCVSAAFFQDCISEQDLDEMNIEIIRNTLYKVKHILMILNDFL